MSSEHTGATPGPDEFDRQLRDLYAGTGGAARFREPSAAERAKRAARRRRQLNPRKSKQARNLRKPVAAGGAKRRTRATSWRRLFGFGRGRPGPARRPAPGPRRQRLRSLAKGTGILIGFVALLVLMHLLGLGPQ